MKKALERLGSNVAGTRWEKPTLVLVTIGGLLLDAATWYVAVKSGWFGFAIILVNRLLLADFETLAGYDLSTIIEDYKEVFEK